SQAMIVCTISTGSGAAPEGGPMGTRSGRQRARHVAVLVVGGLLAVVATGGCGARWDDEQLAEVRARATRRAPSGPNERGTSGSSSDVAAGSPTDPGL